MAIKEYHVRYTGPNEVLKGQTALAHEIPGDEVNLKLQFDDIDNLPTYYTHGWTNFKRKHLEIIRQIGRGIDEDAA